MTGIRIMKDNDNEDGFKNRPKSDYGKNSAKYQKNFSENSKKIRSESVFLD